MKSAIRRKYGPPNTLKVETIEKPTPKKGEVLIKVHVTTVNRTDCAIVTGKPYIMRLFTGLFNPSHPTPGTDFAGEIEAVGEGVTKFKVRDKVWGFKDEGLHSQAEYMTYDAEKNVDFLPKGISYEDAVASLEAPHYAYSFLKKIELKKDSKVLLNGATGGIGSSALQILKSMGVEVTAVCNTKNIELIKSLGADKIYDYEKEDFTKDETLYDFVLDAVGKSSFGKCKPLLKDGGIYISSELGDNWENIFYALFTPFFGKKKVIFPVPSDIKDSMNYMKEMLEEGKFKPVIDRRYRLKEVADAYEYVASGEKTGNVILSMQH